MYTDYDSTFLKPIIEGEKTNVKQKTQTALKIKAWEVRYNRQWSMPE